jgi:CHAT domain-containing protein/tetratricopeptide (TPR) repeat protein
MLALLPLTCWLFLTVPDSLEPPAAAVLAAIRAVEGDSAPALEARWKSKLGRDTTDRAAMFGLATLSRLRYDYPAAERWYRRVLGSDSVGHDALAAYALLGLAQGLDAQGQNAKLTAALDRVRRAAHRVHVPDVEGEALLILSLQRAFSEGIETGLATLDTVQRLVPANRYAVHAERLRQQGALRGMMGQTDARAVVGEALAVARKSGLKRAEAQALKSLAQLLQFEGKRDSSILILQQAEELYRRAHDRGQLSTALLWHVNALLNQGGWGKAHELVHQALIEAQAAKNQFGVAAAYTAAGAIAISLSDYSAASKALDQSIALFHQLGDPGGEMKARDYLAVTALAAGDLPGARRQTLEVLRWYQRTGDPLIQFSAHRNLAIIAMHEGDWPAAQKALNDAHGLARRLNRPLWSADLNYDDGRLALFRGDLAQAEHSLTAYLATLDSSQHVFRHDARVRLADIYARRGDLKRAEHEAAAAWDELEQWRANLSDEELRVLAFQASPTEMSDRDAEVVRVVNEIARAGRVAAAFELAERRRARELADRLAQAVALRPEDTTQSASVELPRGALRVSIADVISHIPDDSTAVLEYVTGSLGAPTTLFRLTRGNQGENLEALTLAPADSLDPRIARFQALVQSGVESAAVAESLGNALLVPAVARLGPKIRRLVIIPDGPLHRLPFDALRLRNGHYAAEQYAISSAPSATVLVALWRRSEAALRPMELLAFGDPTFRLSSDSLPRLRRSGREARLVAQYSPVSEVRLRDDASAAYLKHANLTPFRVLHFATHTLVDEHTAARSALVLAPGDGESGFVGPNDLAKLRLDADLVVLSSCRSAGGVVVNGEGMQGLIAPLFQAGARSVVATRWEIGDRAAVKFVESLYRHLADRRTVGEALRLAKLDAIRDKAPPQEWAAFMIVGDPLVRVPLRAPSWWHHSWLLRSAVGLATGLGLLYWLRTRSGRRVEAS